MSSHLLTLFVVFFSLLNGACLFLHLPFLLLVLASTAPANLLSLLRLFFVFFGFWMNRVEGGQGLKKLHPHNFSTSLIRSKKERKRNDFYTIFTGFGTCFKDVFFSVWVGLQSLRSSHHCLFMKPWQLHCKKLNLKKVKRLLFQEKMYFVFCHAGKIMSSRKFLIAK